MAFPAIPAAITGARGLMMARKAGLFGNPVPKVTVPRPNVLPPRPTPGPGQLMTAASAANQIPPSLAAAGLSVGAISLLNQDPQELGALIAQTNLSLQEGIQQITASAKDVVSLPAEFLDQVKSGYEAEIMRQSSREAAEQQNPLGARSGRQVMQEGGDVGMLPNVAPAPMMEGTPMGGNLSEPTAPAQAELDPAEMQEAQGALMQIIQIIQMLINQGMSEEEIQQFLAQYGITEEELDQAAAILGVDIDALMAGEERMPMAQGMSADLQKFMAQVASRPQRQQQSMTDPLAPARIPRTPEMIIFSINNDIENLYEDYTNAVKSNKFEEAQTIADEIYGLQQQIINLQETKVPPMPVAGLNMRFGGSATGK